MNALTAENRRSRGRAISYLLSALCAFAFVQCICAADRTISENYTLTSHQTVDGVLTVDSGVTVDLNGYHFAVQGLAGEGTITCGSGFVLSDLTSSGGSISWSTKAGNETGAQGGTGANLFNNLTMGPDISSNDKRILVKKSNLPLVVTYDFGGASQKVNNYKMYFTRAREYVSRGPKAWTFEGSNDNETWMTLDSQSNVKWTAYNATTNPYKEFVFDNDTAYRYYRITFTDTSETATNNGGPYLELNQLEYFCKPELRVDVPQGTSATNSTVAIAGSVQLVKAGAGEFVMAKNETYTGGTILAEGTLALIGTTSFDWSTLTFGTDAMKPVILDVGAGATLSSSGDMDLGLISGGSFTLFVEDGGTVNCDGTMRIGRASGSTGVVEVAGGNLTVTSNMGIGADGSSGTLRINGGTVTCGPGDVGIYVGNGAQATGVLELNGGRLESYCVRKSGGAGMLVFNGGTLAATKTTNVLIDNGLPVTVNAGGGTIDNGGFAVGISGNISIAGEGGMTFIGGGTNMLAGAANWTGGTALTNMTVLSVSSAASAANILTNGLSVAIPAGGVSSGTVFMTLEGNDVIDSAWIGPNDVFTGDSADIEGLSFGLSYDRKSVFVKLSSSQYTWAGALSGDPWGGADKWNDGFGSATWEDGKTAVFGTADTVVTLAADAVAEGVVFRANTTVAAGGGTLTASEVVVSNGVSAAIDAPTAGALVKTGAGTLALSQDRADATTLADGTLALTGTASLDWSKFTFGADPAKPVTLDFGENATLVDIPAPWYVGTVENITSTVCKAGGDWTATGDFEIGRANGAATEFYHAGGSLNIAKTIRIASGENGTSCTGYFEISGGSVTNSFTGNAVVVGAIGEGRMTVTNSGEIVSEGKFIVGNGAGSRGILTVVDGGKVTVSNGSNGSNDLVFNYTSPNSTGEINLKSGGVLSVPRMYRGKDGTATFNFDGGTLITTLTGVGDGHKIFSKDAGDYAITVTVSENGGTIDNGGNADSPALSVTITGAGGLTLTGGGVTRVFANQAYLGTTLVKSGTTLSVSGGITFAGPVVFEVGAKLDIAGYVGGLTPLASAESLTLPSEGTVPLTLNGEDFIAGVYAICPTSLVSKAQAEAKFVPSTGNLDYSWDVSATGDLLLFVGDIHGYSWTGLAGDNKFATGGNWGNGIVPSAYGPVDFSSVSSAITVDMDGVTAGTTFGAVTMGSVVITFTGGAMAATSFSDTSKVAVGANSTVTLIGDLVFSSDGAKYICDYIAAGGRFVVTGDIILAGGTTGALYPCMTTSSSPGAIVAKGLVNNQTSNGNDNDWGRTFILARSGRTYTWEIGEDGLSGSNLFYIPNDAGTLAKITATTNFTVFARISNLRGLELDAAGWTIALGDGTNGGIQGTGSTTVSGTGRVVANYDVDGLTNQAANKVHPFTVTGSATLAINSGADLGTGAVTVNNGGTLEVAESGTVALGGNLTLKTGAALGFNFTERVNAPVLDVSSKAVAFDEGATTNVVVKLSSKGNTRPLSGTHVLTSGGKFADATVSLADGAPKWVKDVWVVDGNIVLNVKPGGTRFVVR